MRFWLGTHRPHWLRLLDVPLFVSHRRLREYKTLPRARAPWALDSGGFSELVANARWTMSEDEYVEAVQRYADEVGQLAWAAPMDWMCEPQMIDGGRLPSGQMCPGTGLSVEAHQHLTVENYLNLRDRATHFVICPACGGDGVDPLLLPAGVAEPCTVCTSEGMINRSLFVPVLQGWDLEDYERCASMYADAGVDLTAEPLVGLGSVCRRQSQADIAFIVRSLASGGLRLHGFGMKTLALRRLAATLESADSMAWSLDGRWSASSKANGKKTCANCPLYALQWRNEITGKPEEMTLFGPEVF